VVVVMSVVVVVVVALVTMWLMTGLDVGVVGPHSLN